MLARELLLGVRHEYVVAQDDASVKNRLGARESDKLDSAKKSDWVRG